MVALTVLPLGGLFAQTTAWDKPGGGNWNGAGNWTNGSPNATGANVTLGAIITSDATISIPGSQTKALGILNINSLFNYTVSGGTLDFDNTSGSAQLNVSSSGSPTIASNVTLTDSLAITQSGSGTATLSGIISGAGGLTLSGSGTGSVVLSGANTFTGGTTINQGKLVLNGTDGSNNAVPGALTIGDGSGSAASAEVELLANEQIANATTVNILSDGLLDLNGRNETVTALNLTGGQVATGAGTLSLSAATAITSNASSSGATISGSVLLAGGGTRTISVANGSATNDLTISANITEPFFTSLQKTGTGRLVLSGNNSFTGPLSVQQGVVVAASNNALGATGTSGNSVSSGASLYLSGGVTISEADFSIAGTGTGTEGAIHNLSGSNTLGGTVNVSSAASVTAASGTTLTLTGALNVANNLTIGGAGNTVSSGQWYGSAGVIKTGAGTLTLTGSQAVNITGDLQINQGTVVLNRTAGINTFTGGSIIVGDGTGTDTLQLGANQQIGDYKTITINSSGVFNLNGFNQTLDAVNMTGGSITTGAGTLTLDTAAPITTSASSSTATITGNLALTGSSPTVTVANGSAAIDLDVNGVISGSTSGLTKAGAGTMRMRGTTANTYTGPTTVSGGTLTLAKSSGVNAIVGSSITINSGATLLLGAANQIANAATMTLNGGTFSTGATTGFAETLGALTLAADSVINLGTGSHLLNFANSSAIAWSGSLLTIYGWVGTAQNPGTNGRIFFGSDTTGLTLAQLSKIQFNGYVLGSQLLSNGELVPIAVIPEPGVVVAAILLAGFVVLREFHRRRARLRAAAIRGVEAMAVRL
jgi:autotransporter-associated beta strand protein